MKRRDFLTTGLAAGAGVLSLAAARAADPPPSEQIHVALLGAGEQGRNLISAAVGIPGLKFSAVCDIWKYRRKSAKYLLETYKHEPNEYEDYREMLAAEKDLQAVIVATPDFLHAEQTVACLQAGRHVYCELPMAHSADAARGMVRAMRSSQRLLQIGYQRRSGPRYLHARALLEKKLLGRITHAGGQWCRAVREDLGWPKRQAMPDELLQQHGYASMHELRNWRLFRKFSAGLLADQGAHLVDVAGWLLGARPKTVLAAGGTDYYTGRETCDNLTAILEFPTPEGLVRGTFQVLTTTSGGGNWEQFLGTEAGLRVSESPRWTKLYREPHAPDWEPWVRAGLIVKEASSPSGVPAAKEEAATPAAKPAESEDPNEVHVRETGQVIPYDLPVVADQPPHQPHLENFFDAIRGKAQLACPADAAFATEVVLHRVNEAIAARKMLEFQAADFQVE